MTKEVDNLQNPMTKEEAQAVVMEHLNLRYEKMLEERSKYVDRWRWVDDVQNQEEDAQHRLETYKYIAVVLTDRDLPENDVKDLVWHIFQIEWGWKSGKLVEAHLEDIGLGDSEIAKDFKYHHKDVFDEVMLLFPQMGDVIKDSLDLEPNKFELGFPSIEPWPISYLILTKYVNMSGEQKNKLAKLWLTNFFVHGEQEIVTEDTIYDEVKRSEVVEVVKATLPKFGLNDKEVKGVIQSVIKTFSVKDSYPLPKIDAIINNISKVVGISTISWHNFREEGLFQVLEDTRKRAYLSLFIGEPVGRSWGNLRWEIICETSPFYKKHLEENTRDTIELIELLEKLPTETFLKNLDTYLSKDVINIAEKLSMNPNKMEALLNQMENSSTFMEKMKEEAPKVAAKEEEDKEKEAARKYQEKLYRAIELTETQKVK